MDIFQGVEPIHFALAYAGMLIHILAKVSDLNQNPDFKLTTYVKKNIYTIVATFIMIPVILILLTDTSMKDILPINKVTSVLAGYQTQSTFRTIMNIFKKKNPSTDESSDTVVPDTNNNSDAG